MSGNLQLLFIVGLLVLLAVTLALDPRVPQYRSTYNKQATAKQIAQWQQDIKRWRDSPTWDWFDEPETAPLGRPDFTGSYIFGKYDYRVDVQIRGDRIHYISWGNDDQDNGGAWYSVGEGTRQRDGRWWTVWSCLDLSRAVSNGGGAWFEFDRSKDYIRVEYYHDTLPFGETPMEWGEALRVDLEPGEEMPSDRGSALVDHHWDGRPLEGRVRMRHESVSGDQAFILWGRVVDENGEGVANAAVKRRAHGSVEIHTDSRGFFRYMLGEIESLTLLTAGKLGYYNGVMTLRQDQAFNAIGPRRDTEKIALATITIRKYSPVDHQDYDWVSPEYLPRHKYSPAEHLNCGNCHRREYDDWKESRHATMASNPWMRAAFQQDAMPHLKANGGEDTCTPCHSPSLAAGLERFHVDHTTLLDAKGVDLHGNHCDFCHKIEGVTVMEAPGMNGSIKLLRPDPNDPTVPGSIKRVFGPLPDVSFLYMGAAYNPIFDTGVLCASCHEHHDDGLVSQGTYSEWRQTKYATPGEDYKECQDCHMPSYSEGKVKRIQMPDGTFVESNVGGDLTANEIKNGGVAIARYGTRYRFMNEAHKHSFVGTEDVDFLKSGVEMEVESQKTDTGLRVQVSLSNVGAGHAIPTGHGLKRYVLAVTGKNGEQLLAPIEGFPEDERRGDAAGATTGAILGRQFEDAEGSNWALPWWRSKRVARDTRLMPDEVKVFLFDLPDANAADVKLILRRGPPSLIESHGISVTGGRVGRDDLDTVVHEATVRGD